MKILQKYIYNVFLIILICCLCCSCARNGTDYTVTVDNFDPSGNIVASALGGSPEFSYIYEDSSELSQVSQLIVIGEVIDIQYTDTNARPSTLYDFRISEVLRGNFEKNDVITIEEYGGFVRGSVYKSVYGDLKFGNTLSDDELIQISPLGNAPSPKIGDKYILFLAESDIIPGTYCTFGTYMGKYIIKNGTFVSRHDPDADQTGQDSLYTTEITNTPLTVNDIISSVEETPFDLQLYSSRYIN